MAAVEGGVRTAVQHQLDRNGVIQVFVRRFCAHYPYDAACRIEQGAAAVPRRGSRGEAQPFPSAILLLRCLGGQHSVAHDDPFAECVADRQHRIVDLVLSARRQRLRRRCAADAEHDSNPHPMTT